MVRRGVIIKLLLSCLGTVQTPAAYAGIEDDLVYRGTISWWNTYQHTPILDTAVNPGNRLLKLPETRLTSEFRPNFKFILHKFQTVLRPRVRYAQNIVTQRDEPTYQRTKVDSYFTEGFLQWETTDFATLALGLQNYQWGGAELLSPSNRIFHETATLRTSIFETRGRYLARVNFSLGKTFSTVVMWEFHQNKDIGPYSQEEPWGNAGLIKPEFNWNNGADYLGVVIGTRELGRPWIGEYFNYSLPFFEGLSIYGDASHEQGSPTWYPVAKATPGSPLPLVTFERSKKNQSRVYSIMVGGLRYDFENGTILRLEYLQNDPALTGEERDLALSAFDPRTPLQAQLLPQNAGRYLIPGLELPSRRLAFLSLLVPNPFSINDFNFYIRGLRSLHDQTTNYYANGEYLIGNSGTLSYAFSESHGPINGEIRGIASPLHIIAYRHDW